MLKRSIPFSAVVCICAAILPFARGDNLSVQLFPYTGEVRLGNPNAAAFSFVYYSLSSPGGALNANPAVWKSITDVYDVSGNGLIDPLNNWLKLSASSSQLAEGVIQNPGGSLAPFSVVSLGKVWNRSATPHPDIAAQAVQANQQFATVTTEFGIDGDYNNDNMVNMADYNLWKQLFGQSNNPFSYLADGNLNGVVDAADYTVWRNNVGLNLADLNLGSGSGGPPLGLGQGSAVPEPSAAVLLLTAAGLFAAMRRLH